MHNCPACETGRLVARQDVRTFNPPGREEPIRVVLETSVCDVCGAKVTTRDQRGSNLAALAGRRNHYGEYLTGEEILALRKRYGITQKQASELFGRGKIAFSRYENEASYPDLTMTRLMRLALGDANVMMRLALQAGIELPLLEKRVNAAFLAALMKGAGPASAKRLEVGAGDTSARVGSLVRATCLLAEAVAKAFQSSTPAATQGSTERETQIGSSANDERFALAA